MIKEVAKAAGLELPEGEQEEDDERDEEEEGKYTDEWLLLVPVH